MCVPLTCRHKKPSVPLHPFAIVLRRAAQSRWSQADWSRGVRVSDIRRVCECHEIIELTRTHTQPEREMDGYMCASFSLCRTLARWLAKAAQWAPPTPPSKQKCGLALAMAQGSAAADVKAPLAQLRSDLTLRWSVMVRRFRSKQTGIPAAGTREHAARAQWNRWPPDPLPKSGMRLLLLWLLAFHASDHQVDAFKSVCLLSRRSDSMSEIDSTCWSTSKRYYIVHLHLKW